ncbi:hypothetical protein BJV77DRAFT_1067840 [Russula vinacea]|nr:hypothetical protein BJV77DRAFT_1067840 [Russula vinacea]
MGHLVETCIKPGGKMAGHSLEEAQAAQRTTSVKACNTKDNTASAHVAAATTDSTTMSSIASVPSTAAPTPLASPSPAPTTNPASIQLNGVTYYSGQITTQAAMDMTTEDTHTSWAGTVVHPDNWGFHAYLVVNDAPRVGVDWGSFSCPVTISQDDICPAMYSISHPPVNVDTSLFAFNTAATCHMSLVQLDFKTLWPISKYPVKGLGGATVYAVGIGEINLRIVKGCSITLHDVLFIPASTIHLISVLTLNRSANLTTHFDFTVTPVGSQTTAVHVTGVDPITIRQSLYRARYGRSLAKDKVELSNTCNLYFLSIPSLHVTHSKPSTGAAFYSSTIPNVETWHRRLGHCNVRTVINMAQNRTIKDMGFGPEYAGGIKGY